LFEAIARAGDWITTPNLCYALGQQRLTGSDQRLVERLRAADLVATSQTRAYLVDGTLNLMTMREARRSRRQQQRVNQYTLTARGRLVWRVMAAERRAAEAAELRAAEAARRAELGRVGAWVDDSLYTLGLLWKTFR
jgi:urease accessory protein UreH